MMLHKKRSLLLCGFFFSCLISQLSFSTSVKNRKIEISDLSSFNLLEDNLSFPEISGNKNDEISFLESLNTNYNDEVENVEEDNAAGSGTSNNNNGELLTNDGNSEEQDKTSAPGAYLSRSHTENETDTGAQEGEVGEEENVIEDTVGGAQTPGKPVAPILPVEKISSISGNLYENEKSQIETTGVNPNTVETAAASMTASNRNDPTQTQPFDASVQPHDHSVTSSTSENEEVLTSHSESGGDDDLEKNLDTEGVMSADLTAQDTSSHDNIDMSSKSESEPNKKRRRKLWRFFSESKSPLASGEEQENALVRKDLADSVTLNSFDSMKNSGPLAYIRKLFAKIKEKMTSRLSVSDNGGTMGGYETHDNLEKKKEDDETVPLLSDADDVTTGYENTVMFTDEKVPMMNFNMAVLGVTEEDQNIDQTVINVCADKKVEVSDSLSISKMLNDFALKRELFNDLEERFNTCLLNTFETGDKLRDKTSNKGALLGTLNRLEIPMSFIMNDFAMLRGLEKVSVIDILVTHPFSITEESELYKLNFCLVHPINLSTLLRSVKNTVVDRNINFTDLYNFAMKKSILCHLDAAFNISKSEASNEERLKKLNIFIRSLNKGLNRADKSIVNKTVKEYLSAYLGNSNRCKSMRIYKDNFVQYYMNDVLVKACESFSRETNYWVALAEVSNYTKSLRELMNNCLHNLFYYSAIMDKLRDFVKLLMTYIMRSGVVSCFHINYLLSQYAKLKNLSKKQLPVAPVPIQYENNSVYQMALYMVRRLSHLQLVHDFFECKKSDLADMITRVKVAVTQYRYKIKLSEKQRASVFKKNVLSVIKKYKRELRIKFNEIRLQYLAILKIRYEEQWRKNFVSYSF